MIRAVGLHAVDRRCQEDLVAGLRYLQCRAWAYDSRVEEIENQGACVVVADDTYCS